MCEKVINGIVTTLSVPYVELNLYYSQLHFNTPWLNLSSRFQWPIQGYLDCVRIGKELTAHVTRDINDFR